MCVIGKVKLSKDKKEKDKIKVKKKKRMSDDLVSMSLFLAILAIRICLANQMVIVK